MSEHIGEKKRTVLAALSWPTEPREQWDDLDWIIAECVHERDCNRWPHRACRRLYVRRTSAWNRWVRIAAGRFCDNHVPPALGSPEGGAT